MLPSSNSTDSLLDSFPMFGHPGISALEYAGQADKMKEQSTRLSEVSLQHKFTTTSTHDDYTASLASAGTQELNDPVSLPVQFIDEFGCQQRRRGTFINHTPRNFEIRSSKSVDVHRPAKTESENYSRPLSRQSSMAGGGSETSGYNDRSPSISSATLGRISNIHHSAVVALDSKDFHSPASSEVYVLSNKSHRRSLSVPLSKVPTYQADAAGFTNQPSKEASLRSASLSGHQPQEQKRQRRQTPFKVLTSTHISVPRHAPLEAWVAEHPRKETIETIGDVPFDMDRELSAEIGTFGVIQKYFDSQDGGPVLTPKTISAAYPPPPPSIPLPVLPEPESEPSLRRPLMEPIAIHPIDEFNLPNEPPPVPDRSPKRLTNPAFPLHIRSNMSMDSDFEVAAEGAYSPYHKDDDLHVPSKRAQARLTVGQRQAAFASGGRLAPTILGHDAQVASSDLRLNELSYFLKHTGPSPEPPVSIKQCKKKGMGLFRVKHRKSLAARVGSVEGSPQRARTRPMVPACAQEMTTSGGARHFKIIIPTDTPRTSQAIGHAIPKQRAQRHSRHISISFTEEMMNPLASPDVERMISTFDAPERSFSAPVPKSLRSPKRSPRSPRSVPVDDHPLLSRDEQTRARKLRDLQRIKRKPVPIHMPSEQQKDDATAGAVPTPIQVGEPIANKSAHENEGIEDKSPNDRLGRLQHRVFSLQRQNTQLAEALAKVVGLHIEDGDVKSEMVLKAFQQITGDGTVV